MKERYLPLLFFSLLFITLFTAGYWLSSKKNMTSVQSSTISEQDSSIKTLGVLIFPDFELLDVFGPLEMFGNLPDKIQIILIAEKPGIIASTQGPAIQVDESLENAPKTDWLLIPGGLGTRKEVNNKKLIAWIKQRAGESEKVLTVCTGAALLAKTGFLDGHKATSNKMAFEWVKSQGPAVNWQAEARWVQDANIITSSGVAAGTDMSLFVISETFGKETAEKLIIETEYIWNDNPHFDPFAKKL